MLRGTVAKVYQIGFERSEQTSTVTGTIVAHEIVKPSPLVEWSIVPLRIVGYGRYQTAVGHPAKVVPQPVVPGMR